MRDHAWFRELTEAGPVVMGVLNITPDSFSDGGNYLAPERAIVQARAMLAAGAHIIDVGGESSRPGAEPVSEQAELNRVIPVIEALAGIEGIRLSIDTYKASVMVEACRAGAHLVNDIFALRQPGALAAVADLGVPICLMHMQGQPKTMQDAPDYTSPSSKDIGGGAFSKEHSGEALPAVVAEVYAFLAERLSACLAAGIAKENIWIDPGFGFGKKLADNLQLLRHLSVCEHLGCPILVGMSRKSMIGQLLDRPVSERLVGGLALAARALDHGARVIRTHDVQETVDTIRIWQALQKDPEDFRV